ncbi:MAG: hypothetical protein E7539_03360 [Ruminococcaceae bacterium]|nr:hypothetical protein [Oscillospiraceae bacterium]
METVYVDILIVTNFIVDYFLLMLTSFLSATSTKRYRIFLGAAVAAISSLVIFAPELSAAAEFLIKLVISLLIVLITFGFSNPKRYIKSVVIFYAANAVLAGGAIAVWSIFAPKGLVIRNGAVFYNISPVTLILSIAAVYLISILTSKIISRRQSRGKEYSVMLEFEGKRAEVRGIVDSGNMLHDVLTGTPVIVCDYDKIRPLLTPELEKILLRENFESGFYGDIINSNLKNRFRIIPFESLSGSGVMAALVLDRAVVYCGDKKQEVNDIIMAVTHKKIADGEFDVLLNPELILV